MTCPTYTVLLVEDTDNIRDLFAEILTRAGYSVLANAAGGQALELSQTHTGPIHLLVTDIHLPGQIDGFQLARQLIQQRPALKIVYMSGDVTEAERPEDVAQPGRAFLQKPFLVPTLLETMNRLLS
jgi:CheY-like chemotaxis protein